MLTSLGRKQNDSIPFLFPVSRFVNSRLEKESKMNPVKSLCVAFLILCIW